MKLGRRYVGILVLYYKPRWPTFCYMMTSSNGNIFRVTGHLCGEFTGPRWIPHTKACDADWETEIFWYSPELSSLLYSLYKIPLAQACFPLARPNFHLHSLVSQPVMWSFDVFFDLRLNKRLSKQWRGWWFETLPHPLWCHSNETW